MRIYHRGWVREGRMVLAAETKGETNRCADNPGSQDQNYDLASGSCAGAATCLANAAGTRYDGSLRRRRLLRIETC
jgi:hypothetical protein